jgi:tetratricopeptide (TPR) repeat protein/predicted Ser/Thr protein kinase
MIGTVLNQRFEITTELGHGGTGTVYFARDVALDREVAVKVLSQLNISEQGRAKLLQEAQATAKMNHPNIVAVYDVGETDESPYIVMEYVEGQNLHDAPPTEIAEIVDSAAQICLALDHAHSHGIVHRDLKPENVIIDAQRTAKLMDFGIARSMASRVTLDGEVIGTVFYLAPEIAQGKDYDGRADLYSLGVMLYELTTGELPFTIGDPVAVISQHLHASVVPPRTKNPEIPPRLDALIVQMMSKSPAERPGSASEAHAAFTKPSLLDPEAEEVEAIDVIRRIGQGRFVARERELESTKATWSKVLAGEGQTLLVSGEPGIGKTRLVKELATYAEVTGGEVHSGACYEERNAPYAAFAQIIRSALQTGSAAPTDFVLADLITIAPELRASFPEVPSNPQLEPDLEQRRMFESAVTFFKTLSGQSPLMLFLDNAQWADSGTLALLLHLSRRTRDQPILLAVNYRETQLDVTSPLNHTLIELNRARLSTELKLMRFNRAETRKQLAAIFADEITPEFLDGIFTATEGNPFFVEEVCKALVEDGQVFHTDVGWDRPGMEQIEIPRSIKAAVQSRVAKLPPAYQETLALAAVIGREFDFDTLSQASDLEDGLLIDALESADQAQLIEELKSDNGTSFSFLHTLVPSTLREVTPTLRRRKLHKRVAEAISVRSGDDYEALAYHFAAAGDNDRARQHYTLAGDRASAAYANQEAADYYSEALDLHPSEAERAELLSNLAEALFRLSRWEEAGDSWMQASEIHSASAEWPKFAFCFTRMARAASNAQDWHRALALCEQGLSQMRTQEETPEFAGLLHETARAHYFFDQRDLGEPLCKEALEMARRVNAKGVEAESRITLSLSLHKSTEETEGLLREAIEIAREEGLLSIEARARNALSLLLYYDIGDFRSSEKESSEISTIHRKRGDLGWELYSLCSTLSILSQMGELSEAAKLNERIEKLREGLDREASAFRSERLFGSSEYLYAQGRIEEAAKGYRALMRQPRNPYSDTDIFFAAQMLGYCLMALRKLDEAESVLSSVYEIPDRGFFWQRGLIGPQLSMVLAKQGKLQKSRSLLSDARETRPPERRTMWANLLHDWACACLEAADGSWEAAFRAYEQTVKGMQTSGAQLFAMEVVRDWAEAHLARDEPGDADRAHELLNTARDEYRAMGAERWVARVEDRLEEVGSDRQEAE